MNGLFIGEGTLLVQCAEEFRRAGGEITAIMTREPRVRAWAEAEGLTLFGDPQDEGLKDLTYDYLFSVVNLTIFPQHLPVQPNKFAINFFDGPLPKYAGINVTSWALMNGETSHAVTWHEMLASPDEGRILKSRVVEISPDETSMSLNAKCYEAGLASFTELIGELKTDTVRPQEQDAERNRYEAEKRPEALGALDFTKTASELNRIVRALDFGAYANPLGTAKLWTGKSVSLVGSLAIKDGPASNAPGQVVALDNDGITISASDHDVTVGAFRCLAGEPRHPNAVGLQVGAQIPLVPVLSDEDLTTIAKAELYWQDALAVAQPLQSPYPSNRDTAAGVISAPMPLDQPLDLDEGAAGFLVWHSLLMGAKTVSCGVDGGTMAHPLIAESQLVTMPVEASASVKDTLQSFAKIKTEGENKGPRSIDLIARLPDTATRDIALRALNVAVTANDRTDAELLGDRLLVLALGDTPRLIAKTGLYARDILAAMGRDLAFFLNAFASQKDTALKDLPLTDPNEKQAGMNAMGIDYPRDKRIHDVIREQAAKTPDAIALKADDDVLTYEELEARTDLLAAALAARGAKRGVIVGLCLERSTDLIVSLLAILKTGAAYLPLDPAYPAERVAFMIEDSNAPLIVASPTTEFKFRLDPKKIVYPDATDGDFTAPTGEPSDLAYMMYTSGSTGTPKGVMLTHQNIVNFFTGTDLTVPHDGEVRLLAITSVSFDISVLEIFWTLARGFTIVLQTDGVSSATVPGFSLFYFASEASGSGPEAYRLLLQGAKFADDNGFEAVWTPERHFHAFGGLYPNPAVSSAAVASMTKNVGIRAGSCVLPLHNPVRLAEDWALVDNISAGRAGIALASGWQPNDFVLQPENFENRKDVMLDGVDTLRKLWRGESIKLPNHKGEEIEVSTLPHPVNGDIPLWLTAAGNPETFAAAATKGCYVLTHLLGQKFEDVAEKIRAYRMAWREAGHPGNGKVSLMLHTFVGEDEDQVRETVRGPMKGYLKSSVDLLRRASWSSPTFKQKADASGVTPQEVFEKQELTDEETDALLDHAFERYYQTSGLFGTPDSCQELVREIARMGVDEIACLIDFGVDTDLVLKHLTYINDLKNNLLAEGGVARQASVAEQIVEHDITHFQCTPSMASFLVAEEAGRTALGRLKVMMVGGEGFPPDLARNLRSHLKGSLLNMYGTTETAVWSSVANLETVEETIPLGEAIANTIYSVRNEFGQALPSGVAGELWIGGDGVADGYWKREELTAERFLDTAEGRFYRTGDLVRHMPNGNLEFHGRMDNQVKVRGHRIELGEIEAKLGALDEVKDAAVTVFETGESDKRLVAFATAAPGHKIDPQDVRKKLGERLPEFMTPSQVIVLDVMPQTPNGKIDRKALPKPQGQTNTATEAAQSDTETAIAKIWCEALGLAEVGVTDNFFDLGGHSLLVVQVQRRLKELFDKEVAITDMFRFSTIQALAGHLDGDGKADGESSAAKRGAERAAARRARMTRRTGTTVQ
ncbi:MupA/Atu3671 family FMN-dependent luciferase-like monooxygenase [Sneathiella sp. HT1-7]|uniref:MupA/Atu3671 family FMN-dependent luciferase-like monooxygenase n=1 Tax=Sneathiella sp. HT1-7 TaxID=2887192 RepID=UPI001D144356|nr:MupA/Atu3671 family FMN-dependent luciferase-like monooxygenase [Sneathiella sp. HT1-7]MCC3304024.1 LLM class flavin-dependent oxidoreductase [Sneathiella sp. HT1-7]